MDRIFYKSSIVDQVTGSPIYIFDTALLPSTDLIDYNAFINLLVSCLPQEKYVLIMFSCGLNKISWIWGLKFLKSFLGTSENENLERIERIITVHDSWFIKSIIQIMKNYNITKKNFGSLNRIIESFSNKQINFDTLKSYSRSISACKNLSGLAKEVDITKIKVSLAVYKFDTLVDSHLIVPNAMHLINPKTKIDIQTDPLFFSHFYQLFNIISSHSTRSELVFLKPGNKVSSSILYSCVDRNQALWINDWDLYSIAATFKKIIMELPGPLISIERIAIPMKDHLEYTKYTFERIISSYNSGTNYAQVLVQILELCYKLILNTHITKHTSATLSKSLSHCLSHEIISLQNRDVISIINRFIRNLLNHWSTIRRGYVNKYPSIEDIVNGSEENSEILNSYDRGHELSVLDEHEDDSIDTTNILGTLSSSEYELRNSDFASSDGVLSSFKSIKISNAENKHLPALKEVDSEDNSDFKSENIVPNLKNKADTNTLSDISNIAIQFPPQKYKFKVNSSKKAPNASEERETRSAIKMPVIRGRKVSEIARIFEERARGMEILQNMK